MIDLLIYSGVFTAAAHGLATYVGIDDVTEWFKVLLALSSLHTFSLVVLLLVQTMIGV